MLILQTLTRGDLHGYGIAQSIKLMSEEALQVEEGSLYPALQRLLLKGWVEADWGRSKNNRRARFYRVTADGREQLGREVSKFEDLLAGIQKVLRPV